METTIKEEAGKRFRTLQIIWVALLCSVLMCLLICHFIPVEVDMVSGPAVETLVYIFYGLAVFQLFLAHFLRRALLSTGEKPSAAVHEEQTDRSQKQRLAKYAAAVIVALALAESIGIFGLVLFVLTGKFQTLYILIVLSAAGIIYHRPKKEELEELLPGIRLD